VDNEPFVRGSRRSSFSFYNWSWSTVLLSYAQGARGVEAPVKEK